MLQFFRKNSQETHQAIAKSYLLLEFTLVEN